MTCIAAIADGETVWMGGDSETNVGDVVNIQKRPKVFRLGDFLIGTAGNTRPAQVIEFGFNPPVYGDGEIEGFIAIDFIHGLKDALRFGGCLIVEDGIERMGLEMLVGFRGRLFCINRCFGVTENAWGYDAIGIGQDVARGVIFARDVKEGQRVTIIMALAASTQHCAGTSGPFSVCWLSESKYGSSLNVG